MKSVAVNKMNLVLAFLAVYIIWGTTYLAAMMALGGLPPFLISAIRYLVAGILLTAWVTIRGSAWPGRMEWMRLGISGIVMLVGGSGLVVFAEQYISSGYAAVIVATEPLWFILLDRPRWKQYFRNRLVVLGLLIGFIGIALFSWFAAPSAENGTGQVITGTLILLLSAVLWVAGTLYGSWRGHAQTNTGTNISRTSIQLLAAGVFALLLSGVLGEWREADLLKVSARAWFGVAYLVIMGSLVAYVAFTWLVTVQPPAVVGTHTYVNPVVAVFAGWWFAGETVNKPQLVSLLVVLAGVLITQVANNRSRRSGLRIPDQDRDQGTARSAIAQT